MKAGSRAEEATTQQREEEEQSQQNRRTRSSHNGQRAHHRVANQQSSTRSHVRKSPRASNQSTGRRSAEAAPVANQQSSPRKHERVSPPGGEKRQRHRIRRDKGKWKPYHTLTWEERKVRDAQETQRAEEKRAQLTHLGYPQAPYNTTQFLMADHSCENGHIGGGGSSEGIDAPSSDESSTAEEDWDRGYDQEWNRALSEQLFSLSKNELVAQVLEREQEKSKLEQRVKALEQLVTPPTEGAVVTNDAVENVEGLQAVDST